MRQLGYYFFKYGIATGLFWYYHKITVEGLNQVPKDKPVLFLSNHQNALMDVLLMATRCNRKPWFLTRSDIFKNRFFRGLFYFLQMLPIYRLRDGKSSLAKNQAIFDRCGALLGRGEALLIFPEANHSLKRRVRPLSKGFTRLIFNALEKDPKLDLQLIPIGQNYQNPTQIGDSATIYFGAPIAVQDFLVADRPQSIENIKAVVAASLKTLTVHIEDESSYEQTLVQLRAMHTDFTNPKAVNAELGQLAKATKTQAKKPKNKINMARILFSLCNLPVVVLWRVMLKPKVPEPEFMDTFRFVFAMLVYPICYLLLFIYLSQVFDAKTACLMVIGHAVLNLVFIKSGWFTSSAQRI